MIKEYFDPDYVNDQAYFSNKQAAWQEKCLKEGCERGCKNNDEKSAMGWQKNNEYNRTHTDFVTKAKFYHHFYFSIQDYKKPDK